MWTVIASAAFHVLPLWRSRSTTMPRSSASPVSLSSLGRPSNKPCDRVTFANRGKEEEEEEEEEKKRCLRGATADCYMCYETRGRFFGFQVQTDSRTQARQHKRHHRFFVDFRRCVFVKSNDTFIERRHHIAQQLNLHSHVTNKRVRQTGTN